MRKVNLKINFEDNKGDSITSTISKNSSENNEDKYIIKLDSEGLCTLTHTTDIITDNRNIFKNPSFSDNFNDWILEGEWEISDNGFVGPCAYHKKKDVNVSIGQYIDLTLISSISFYIRCDENIAVKCYLDSDLFDIKYLSNDNWNILSFDMEEYTGSHNVIISINPSSKDLYMDTFKSEFINNEIIQSSSNFQTYYNIIPLELPYGEYTINTISDNNIYSNNLIIENVEDVGDDEDILEIEVNLGLCGEVLLEKNCKYFHHEPYMTPNNYDLYFDYRKIPVNNILEPPHELKKRLQRHLPVTKILHLNLEDEYQPQYNNVFLHSSVSIKYNQLKDNLDIALTVNTVWNDSILLELLTQEEHDKIVEWVNDLNESLSQFSFQNLTNLTDIQIYNCSFEISELLDNPSLEENALYGNIRKCLEDLIYLRLRNVTANEFNGIELDEDDESPVDYIRFTEYLVKTLIYDEEKDVDKGVISDLIENHNTFLDDYKSDLKIPVKIVHDYTISDMDVEDDLVLDNLKLNKNNSFSDTTSILLPLYDEDISGDIDISKPFYYKPIFEEKYLYKCDDCGKIYSEIPEKCCKSTADLNTFTSISLFNVVLMDYDKSYSDRVEKKLI